MHTIGIVGLGIMGRRLMEGFRADPGFHVRAAYDPHRTDSDVPLVPRLEDLMADPAIDCLYIATPPATHESIIRAAAQAGKAVFCEKPLAASPASARACIDAVAGMGAKAAVNFPFATAAAALRLKELVETGALGRDLSAHLTLRFKTWPRGWQHGAKTWLAGSEQGGFTREVTSHFVFLALRLFGPGTLMEKSVERGPEGTETRVRAVLQFADVRLVIDGAVEGEVEDFNRFEVKGSEGVAVLGDWYRLEHQSGNIAPSRPDAGQIAELGKLLAGEPNRLATFDEAAQVVELIEGILV